jgi:head-tail adaptor
MEAGTLRHRVTLQSPTGDQDAVGERDTEYTDVATVWPATRRTGS